MIVKNIYVGEPNSHWEHKKKEKQYMKDIQQKRFNNAIVKHLK